MTWSIHFGDWLCLLLTPLTMMRFHCLLQLSTFGLLVLLASANASSDGKVSIPTSTSSLPPSHLPDSFLHFQSVCENKGTQARPILCVGMLKNYLLLVTEPENNQYKDQLVYKMPVTSLNESIDRLYISVEPKTVSSLWPKLYKNTLYANAAFYGHIYNAFTAVDEESEYFFITTKEHDTNLAGVIYDIEKDEAFTGIMYHGDQTQVIISSNQLSEYFAINKEEKTGGLSIMRYKFTQKTVRESVTKDNSIVPEEPNFYSMCKVGDDSIMVDKNRTGSCTPLDWPLNNGFVSGDKYYIFGSTNIFIFAKSVYDVPNKPVPFTTVKYADFIQCNAEVVKKKDKAGK